MRVVASIFTVLLLLTSAVAQTEAPNLLCGTVRDEHGGSLPGVRLKAKQNGRSKIYEISTDSEGKFRKLSPGTYRLIFVLGSFKTRRLNKISSPLPCFDVEMKSAVRPHNIT